MRLLYGYRKREDRPGVRVEPSEAAVVCAVLAWPAVRGRIGLGNRIVRQLTKGLSAAAVQALVFRIRHHADAYRRGQAHPSLPPDPDLVLSGQPMQMPYKTGAPSCGSGLFDRHANASVARPRRCR